MSYLKTFAIWFLLVAVLLAQNAPQIRTEEEGYDPNKHFDPWNPRDWPISAGQRARDKQARRAASMMAARISRSEPAGETLQDWRDLNQSVMFRYQMLIEDLGSQDKADISDELVRIHTLRREIEAMELRIIRGELPRRSLR